jgi:hypothetical protein
MAGALEELRVVIYNVRRLFDLAIGHLARHAIEHRCGRLGFVPGRRAGGP